MTADRIEWIEVPDEVRDAATPFIKTWIKLLPSWLESLQVQYRSGQTALSQIKLSYPNRWAILYLTGAWLDLSQEEREITILHEFAHALLEPGWLATNHIIDAIFPEDKEGSEEWRAFAMQVVKDGYESSVEDIARSLLRIART